MVVSFDNAWYSFPDVTKHESKFSNLVKFLLYLPGTVNFQRKHGGTLMSRVS